MPNRAETHILTSKDNFLLDLSSEAFTRAQADRLAFDIRQKLGDPTIFCSTVVRIDNLVVYRITTQQNARALSRGLLQIIPELDTATADREFRQ